MKEFYPYTIVPQKVDRIRQEGIPAPKLPKLLPVPEKTKRKYLGTIILAVSLIAFFVLNIFPNRSEVMLYTILTYFSFFIMLISLVASIFEFVQYGKLKKQYQQDLKLYIEHKEAYIKLKNKQEKIEKENKDEKLVKEYRQNQINEFFKNSYNVIIAVHNEYSQAKKRFKLFLEEYFPDEVLDNVKVMHETKNLDYVPDFIIQFGNPKLNVAIEIEEPYTLSNIPENIQKDYEAKDRIRQRFANELGWIVIVLSEEQAVVNPTQCCKFIEESIELLFDNIKSGDQFVNIKPIKKQKMLTGEERANLKKSKYREKYLIEAGLMDGTIGYPKEKNEEEKAEKISEINGNGKIEKELVNEVNDNSKVKLDLKNTMDEMKTPQEKKKEIENEQMQLIKKIALKIKTVSDENETKKEVDEPIKYKTDDSLKTSELEEPEIEETEIETKESSLNKRTESTSQKGKQLRREEDILNDLYKALDKHSRKQQERKEKRLREVHKKVEHKIEEKLVEEIAHKVENTEKREKSAAEIILERKRELEKSLSSGSKDKEEKETPVIEKQEIKKVVEETSEIETKKIEKADDVEKKIIEEKKEIEVTSKETLKEEKIEEEEAELEEKEDITVEAIKVVEAKKELGIEAIKNQELIDAYRQKIEGAVFDKQWDELLEVCDKAIKEIPYWDWAYYRRSTAWGAKKEFTKVILDCNRAIGFNPTLADAYYNRGTARFFLGKYIEASDDYQKAIDLNYVKKADAYFNRGLCFQKLDHHKKAYREFLKAKEMGNQKAIEIIKANYQQ